MNCPFCSIKLRRVKVKSEVLDICPRCKGIWFDSGEFVNFIRELTKSEDIRPETLRLFESRKINTLETIKEEDKICPHCELVMHRFNYCYDSNVFLDKCPRCHGIWTDAEEVLKIAQYMKVDPRIVEIGEEIAIQIEKQEHIKELGQLGKDLSSRISRVVWFMPHLIIPISDEVERERLPVITIAIILLCALVFLGEIFWIADAEGFLRSFGFIAGQFFSVGLITSMFLHGGLIHLIGNMYFLWLFGDNVEDRFTRLGYVTFYLCCGIAASVTHSIFNWHSTIPAVGASGAISGVMGAYMIFYPVAMIKVLFICRVVDVPAWMFLGTWFIFQLVFGLMHNNTGYSNIAWFAHIGGFICGVFVAYYKKTRKRGCK
ncbi:MAG: rhomboid family intramembrane serine protease [Phycisphaerae bacterium]